MEELVVSTLAGIALAVMMLTVTMLPIALIVGVGLGIVWIVECCQRLAIRDLLVVTIAIAKIFTLLSAVIRSSS
jgi:hypothetical protein